ncbi:(2Fe-2S)-binding protein [Thalassoglobus sp.]|uniref:(2Fe-2S)-binding protein n=1 Tax=Thalassoglobus sp. TaxID=2795869 RepID=UPI003AA8AF84
MSQTVINDAIVCRCLNVRESTIQDSVEIMGAESLQDVKSICGAGGGCMSCRSRIKCLISEYLSNRDTVKTD